MSKKETFDMAALVPPTLNQTTTVKFNAGQFVSMKKDKVTKHYRMEDRLGSGGYGEVFLCKHKGSGSERAVKVIEKGRWNAEEEKQFLDEFAIVKDLDHPNILKMYETFEDLNNFYIVTDVYGVCATSFFCPAYLTIFVSLISLVYLIDTSMETNRLLFFYLLRVESCSMKLKPMVTF